MKKLLIIFLFPLLLLNCNKEGKGEIYEDVEIDFFIGIGVSSTYACGEDCGYFIRSYEVSNDILKLTEELPSHIVDDPNYLNKKYIGRIRKTESRCLCKLTGVDAARIPLGNFEIVELLDIREQ